MEIKEYIESGILEQYVLGQTTPEQTIEVTEMAASHPEIKAEIEAIEDALFNYAQTHATLPPPKIREQLFSKLELDDLINEQPEAAPKTVPFNQPYKIPGQRSNFNYFMIAASILLLAVSIFGNIWLYNKWQNSENQLVILTSERQLLAGDLKTMEAKFATIESQMTVLKDPDVKPVVMKGLPLMPQALATIYWNTKNTEVYINASTLPETNETEQYQLWAIVDGKPVDAGVFNTKDALAGLVKMKSIQNATAFAVTIEKKGGSAAPTLEKMVLMGASS